MFRNIDHSGTMFILQGATTLTILLVYTITLLTPLFCPKPANEPNITDLTSISGFHGK